MFKVPIKKITYTTRPNKSIEYTKEMDKIYTRYAKMYDVFMVVFPLWKKWLCSVLPFVQGERIIDISFGPAYLLSKLPANKQLYGLDYNETMVKRAKIKMEKCNKKVDIISGNVESMPYPDEYFDTIINTMAFSGYPDGEKAILEMLRTLKKDGILLLLDYDYPPNRNFFGYYIVRFIELCGDIMKDIGSLIEKTGCKYDRKIVGGFGSVQLFIVRKIN